MESTGDKLNEVLEEVLEVGVDKNVVDDEFKYDKNGDRRKKSNRDKGIIDKVGLAYYGELFRGYQKIGEYQDLIPAFKEFYYQKRIEDPKMSATKVVRLFNDELHAETGRTMHPYTNQVKLWKTKWDKDILEKKAMMVETVTTKKNVSQVLKTRTEGDNGLVKYTAPTYEDLEQATQSLGGELVNDALNILKQDQDLEDFFESDELMKRKTYVVNVFSHVTKLVHGKAALLLKASQEKRENVSFLMDLMKKATSGKMGEEEINALRSSYQPVQPQEENVQGI